LSGPRPIEDAFRLPFFGEEKVRDALDFTTGKILTEGTTTGASLSYPKRRKPYLDGSGGNPSGSVMTPPLGRR